MTVTGKYTRPAVALHWIVAVLIVGNAALGLSFDYLPDEKIRFAIDTHKSIGITVLGLAVLRALWRATHKPPELPGSMPLWERLFAMCAHWLLYVLIFALPLSGWMHDSAWKDADTHPMNLFGLMPWPRIGVIMEIPPDTKERLHDLFGALHESLSYALYGLLALHVGGALKHAIFDRMPHARRGMLP